MAARLGLVENLGKRVFSQRTMDFTMRESRLLRSQITGSESYLWVGWSSSGAMPKTRLVMEEEVYRGMIEETTRVSTPVQSLEMPSAAMP